jgi:hypothetical protein|eukprot:COSAG03_NODE_540_length_7071_cov_7.578887_3_plen_478_part_00
MQRPRRAAPHSHSAVATAQTDGTAPGVYTAAISGDFEYLLQLLDAGAPTDTYTQGWTPLHAACANGHEKVAAALVAAGADATVRSKDDEMLNPAELAELHGHQPCAQLIKREAKRQAVRRAAANSPQRMKRLDRQREYAHRLSSPVRPRMHPPASRADQDLDRDQPLPQRQSSRPKLRPRSQRGSAQTGKPQWKPHEETDAGRQHAANGHGPTGLSPGSGELAAIPVDHRSNTSAPPVASNRAAKLREMAGHGELNGSKDEHGSFGVERRFGRGGIYPERVSSPIVSHGVARSRSRSVSPSVSPSRRRQADDAHGHDSQATDSAWLSRELVTERNARKALDGELRVTRIALRKSQAERVAWQERALAAEQALRELQSFAEERSQFGHDTARPADAELAELHELIANQAQTIDTLAKMAELPLDDESDDDADMDAENDMGKDDTQQIGAAVGTAADSASHLPRSAWPEDVDPPDDSME